MQSTAARKGEKLRKEEKLTAVTMQPSNGLIEIDEPPPAFVSVQKHSTPRHSRQGSQITLTYARHRAAGLPGLPGLGMVWPGGDGSNTKGRRMTMKLSAVVVGDTNLPTGWASS